MRTFRRAALASATAVALTLGASTVAVANENAEAQQSSNAVNSSEKKEGNETSSKIKDSLGSSKEDGDKKSSDNETSSKIKDSLGSSKEGGDKKSSDNEMSSKAKDSLGSSKDGDKGTAGSSKGNSGLNSSEFGKMLDGKEAVNGRDVFGSETSKEIPAWARVLRLITATTLIGGFFGLVVFPVYNFLKFNNWVR